MINDEVRELLAAIRDALDSTGLDEAGMRQRMAHVKVYTASVHSDDSVAGATELLRELTGGQS